jgi:hypothetical protein
MEKSKNKINSKIVKIMDFELMTIMMIGQFLMNFLFLLYKN